MELFDWFGHAIHLSLPTVVTIESWTSSAVMPAMIMRPRTCSGSLSVFAAV
jgi:hypothetical protein